MVNADDDGDEDGNAHVGSPMIVAQESGDEPRPSAVAPPAAIPKLPIKHRAGDKKRKEQASVGVGAEHFSWQYRRNQVKSLLRPYH